MWAFLSGRHWGSGPGLLVPPLSLPAVASPPPSACRIHHCCSAVLSGALRRGWGGLGGGGGVGVGAELTPPDLATPTPRYLAPTASCSLQHHRPFLLLFPASSRPCFVCSCLFFFASPSFSLSPGHWGGGRRPKALLAPPSAPQLELELVRPKLEPDPVPAVKVSLLHGVPSAWGAS